MAIYGNLQNVWQYMQILSYEKSFSRGAACSAELTDDMPDELLTLHGFKKVDNDKTITALDEMSSDFISKHKD